MKFTKDQRFSIYCAMLQEAESPDLWLYKEKLRSSIENGLCWMFKMMFGDDSLYRDDGELLPELDLKIVADSWEYGDWEVRKEALIQCIEETA